MPPIKLLTAHSPQPRWRALEIRLREDRTFEHLGQVDAPIDLLLGVGATKADAVVLFADDADEHGILSHLLAEYPDLIVLVLAASGQVFMEARCQVRRHLDDGSSMSILNALREAVARPCDAPGRDGAAGDG